jgi:hypothetical protein
LSSVAASGGTFMSGLSAGLDQFMVNWREVFAAPARVRFVGPVTIEVRYETKDEINAFRHDLDFVRKQVAAAYGAL